MSSYLFNPKDIPADWSERLEQELVEKVKNTVASPRTFQWVKSHIKHRIRASHPMIEYEDFDVGISMEKGGDTKHQCRNSHQGWRQTKLANQSRHTNIYQWTEGR